MASFLLFRNYLSDNRQSKAVEKLRLCANTHIKTQADLHILKGDLPVVTEERILGHEGIGVVEEVGPGVSEFHV